MSCAKSNFRGETGLPHHWISPALPGHRTAPWAVLCFLRSDFPLLQAGQAGSVKL
jgi:hypothetical protein